MITVNKAALMVAVGVVCLIEFMAGCWIGRKKGFERGMEAGWKAHELFRKFAVDMSEFCEEEECDG